MDISYINILSNGYESILSTQLTKSLGKSVVTLYSNIACSALGFGNQQVMVWNVTHFLTLRLPRG